MKGLYIYKSLNKIQFVKEIKIKTVSNFLKVTITYEPNHMYQIALQNLMCFLSPFVQNM